MILLNLLYIYHTWMRYTLHALPSCTFMIITYWAAGDFYLFFFKLLLVAGGYDGRDFNFGWIFMALRWRVVVVEGLLGGKLLLIFGHGSKSFHYFWMKFWYYLCYWCATNYVVRWVIKTWCLIQKMMTVTFLVTLPLNWVFGWTRVFLAISFEGKTKLPCYYIDKFS